MDKYERSNKQYKTTDTSPELRKARCDIARVLDLLSTERDKLNKYKHCQEATWNLWNIIIGLKGLQNV